MVSTHSTDGGRRQRTRAIRIADGTEPRRGVRSTSNTTGAARAMGKKWFEI